MHEVRVLTQTDHQECPDAPTRSRSASFAVSTQNIPMPPRTRLGIRLSSHMRLKLPINSAGISTKLHAKPHPQQHHPSSSCLPTRHMVLPEDGHDPHAFNLAHLNKPHQAPSLILGSPSTTGHPQYFAQFFDSLESLDFQSAIERFNRLSFDQKSRLSTQTYSSIFSLASRVHQDDQLIESTDPHQPEFQEKRPYKVDYCKLHARLITVDQAFQSAKRAFSTEQLHTYLQITILAAALQLRKYAPVPPSPCSSSTQPTFDSVFLHFHQLITNIIQRIPALNQAPNPTSHQLAEVIPFNILGLYLRFLVVFHRPNQGLKLIRKIYYAYLINRKKLQRETDDENSKERSIEEEDQSSCDHVFVIETGSLIISLLRHKIHHRLAALKLGMRMITIGQIYPNPTHFTSLLRRMYMSKSEWDSVIQFQGELMTSSELASNWLKNQIAIVEAEDGRVERALSLSAEVLKLPPDLHGDFLSPATGVNSDIFAHAIHALINNHPPDPHSHDVLPGGLRGAIAVRTKMLESGHLPPPESDDLILRRICNDGQKYKCWCSRREFLKEMIVSMFPIDKIVPVRSDSLRCFRFKSHPGRSPEAFRLMRWLLRWNELDLSLRVFHSLSKYGYVSSFTSIPLYHLKKILNKALSSHPELAMELYQHFHMSGADRSGELFKAIQVKSIKMGDHQLASYLLRIIDQNYTTTSNNHQEDHLTHQITHFLVEFSNRQNSPGNLLKTLLLYGFIWIRWPHLIPLNVLKTVLNTIKRVGSLKLSQRPEVILQVEKFIRSLDVSVIKHINPSEICFIKKELDVFLASDVMTSSSTPQPSSSSSDTTEKLAHDNYQIKNYQHDSVQEDDLAQIDELIMKYLNKNHVSKAVEITKKAISLDILIQAPVIGRLLNRLTDDLLNEFNKNKNRSRNKELKDEEEESKKKKINQEEVDNYYYEQRAKEIFKLNQSWRAMSWRFSSYQKGNDLSVVKAGVHLFKFLNLIHRNISL